MQTIRPAADDYAARCREITRTLAEGLPVFLDLIERMTSYKLVLAMEKNSAEDDGWVFVAATGHGAYWFDLNSYLHPSFVAEKLNVTRGDGDVLAEFLTRLGASRRITAV
jgi:hypothetical protein